MALCDDCVTGVLHEGTPLGSVTTSHGLPAYTTNAEGPSKGVIVIIPDIFGWELNNARLLADTYAKRTGCTTILPDFMDGGAPNPPAARFDDLEDVTDPKLGILSKVRPVLSLAASLPLTMFRLREAVTHPRVFKYFADLRAETPSSQPVFAAGFCWGGKFVYKLSAANPEFPEGKPLLTAGFTAHPSLVTYPDDVEAIVSPVSTIVGEVDPQTSKENAEATKRIFAAKPDSQNFQIVVLPDAPHGFAVRALKTGPGEKVRQQAEDQAVEFFKRFIPK